MVKLWMLRVERPLTAAESGVLLCCLPPERRERLERISRSSGKADTHGVDVGRIIEHERFGRGEVVRLEGSGDNCKATVRFESRWTRPCAPRSARAGTR